MWLFLAFEYTPLGMQLKVIPFLNHLKLFRCVAKPQVNHNNALLFHCAFLFCFV